MLKGIFIACFLIVLVAFSGCLGIGQDPMEAPKSFEKYGFGMTAPENSEWLDWSKVPMGQALFQAMASDAGSEMVFLLMKSEGDDLDMSFIGVLMADNETEYSSVSEIPLDDVDASEISGIGLSGTPEVKRMGGLDWIIFSSEETESKEPILSDLAVTFCNDKVVAVLLINGRENPPENRSYFGQIVESGRCQ